MGAETGVGSRRVFGGSSAELTEFPVICALLDRYWSPRCSASVLNHHWVLTAAHCVTRKLAYVKYNTRRPTSPEGDVTPIHYLYRHPKFEVIQADEGNGPDVTHLHHDVGLVRTRTKMRLASAPPHDVITNLRRYSSEELWNKDIKVLGFGRTERSILGEELFSVQLRLVGCEREGWYHCVCGVAQGRDPRGVCSGDSGGPVLFEGVQVGVTSMGPTECSRAGALPPGATSVFTTLHQYADLVNATISDAEEALRMRIISGTQGIRGELVVVLGCLALCAVIPSY
ncbi:unnamed protein product [Colias eurytheme]|nr:unnamed protein product [Colias eurytheme]